MTSSNLLSDVLESCWSIVRVTEVRSHGWVLKDDLLYGTAALWRSCDSHMRILRCKSMNMPEEVGSGCNVA